MYFTGHCRCIYRKTSNTSHRLLLEQNARDPLLVLETRLVLEVLRYFFPFICSASFMRNKLVRINAKYHLIESDA